MKVLLFVLLGLGVCSAFSSSYKLTCNGTGTKFSNDGNELFFDGSINISYQLSNGVSGGTIERTNLLTGERLASNGLVGVDAEEVSYVGGVKGRVGVMVTFELRQVGEEIEAEYSEVKIESNKTLFYMNKLSCSRI